MSQGTSIILLVLLLSPADNATAEDAKTFMTALSINIARQYAECRHMIKDTPEVVDHLMNYWQENKELVSRDMGCAVHCILRSLQLVDHDGPRENNIQGFAMANGADEDMTKMFLERCRNCHMAITLQKITDDCLRGLEIAVCFRAGMQELGWLPDVEELKRLAENSRKYYDGFDSMVKNSADCNH